jgi:S-layer homology domain
MFPRTASRRVPGLALLWMFSAAIMGAHDLHAGGSPAARRGIVLQTPGSPLVENFDAVTPPALPFGWIATNSQGQNPLWASAASGNAYTPPNSAFLATGSGPSFDERLDSPPVSIATNAAQLRFQHAFAFAVDPGALPQGDVPQEIPVAFGDLEISIAGGAFQNLITAGGSFVTGGPESGGSWISQNSAPPVCCAEVVANLPPAAAGTVVVLRWRATTTIGPNIDGSAEWWIDAVQICDGYPCDGVPQPVMTDVDSAGNGVWEPGETVDVAPTYDNDGNVPLDLSGTATSLTGPAGAAYSITDSAATYGSIDPGAQGSCSSTPDCYSVSVDDPAVRPAAHWDAQLVEAVSSGVSVTRVLHIGSSFTDVPVSYQFYKHVENLYHNGITGGCDVGLYCPGSSVTRAQMAVFLLKAKHGVGYVPPTCSGVFGDVICPSQFADWIEELHAEGITGGCGNGDYCPGNPVTREQMAVFLLKAEHGSGYVPPVCTGVFSDVACPSGFANWIEELFVEGITGGCGVGLYCPTNPNTRGQMAVFLVNTFGLRLYGP